MPVSEKGGKGKEKKRGKIRLNLYLDDLGKRRKKKRGGEKSY